VVRRHDIASHSTSLSLEFRGEASESKEASMRVLARGSLILLIATSAAGASSDARITKTQRHINQAIAVLSQRPDADSLAAAGLMSIGRYSDRSLLLLTQAVTTAPVRADLVWLQSLHCAQLPSCDPLPIERRLRELDPTNGAGWWGAIARAGAANDTEGLDAALTAISRSQRVDIYWTTLIAHLTRAVASTQKMSIEEAEVTIIGYIAAQAIPAYQSVSTNCKGERLQQPGITEICRGVAKAMQNGDTYVTEMIGVAIAKRVWPEESPEWKAAAEQRRVYDYRAMLYPKLEQRALTHPEEYLILCEQHRRESDLFAAQLKSAGYDSNPPPQP
jgi:hypothetical protein